MENKVAKHMEICKGLNALYERKNHDYGDSFHATFMEEGLAMVRIRLSDKLSRFKTLSRLDCSDSDQQLVTDESMRDTLLDLANYAIMTVLEMDEAGGGRAGASLPSASISPAISGQIPARLTASSSTERTSSGQARRRNTGRPCGMWRTISRCGPWRMS